MGAHQALVDDFLAQKRIAVAGVSRSGQATGNIIYKKFKDNGYQVFALNPNADTVEGDRAYPSLQAIAGGVDGVVIITRPEDTERIVRDAAEAGVKRVWMHDNTFTASCGSEQATAYCKEHGIAVIDIGCPMMFLEPDIAHKCMRWWLRGFGKMPK